MIVTFYCFEFQVIVLVDFLSRITLFFGGLLPLNQKEFGKCENRKYLNRKGRKKLYRSKICLYLRYV